MAKKSTSTSKHKRSKRSSTKESSDGARALTGPRILHREVEEYTGRWDTPSTSFPAYKNWTPSTSGTSLMNENYFDLSGYEHDFLTLIPSGATLQDPGYYVTDNVSPLTGVVVLDIISQERLDHDTVETDWLQSLNVPSMPTTTEDFNQIVFGQFRWFAPQTDFTLVQAMSPISRGNFGSSSPTTVAKLWCYRFLIVTSVDLTNMLLTVNATRFVLGSTIVKEKDLSFIMRQKRSYELGTG